MFRLRFVLSRVEAFRAICRWHLRSVDVGASGGGSLGGGGGLGVVIGVGWGMGVEVRKGLGMWLLVGVELGEGGGGAKGGGGFTFPYFRRGLFVKNELRHYFHFCSRARCNIGARRVCAR